MKTPAVITRLFLFPSAGCGMSRPDKAAQRRAALAARRALSPGEREIRSRELCRRILALPELQSARTVMTYAALYDEADLTALNKELLRQGKRLAYPLCGENGSMEAYIPRSPEAMQTGAFGITEPVPALSRHIAPEELDLVLVPCVGFDAVCRRIGRGGGYYDRWLPRCKNARFVGAAFEVQRLYEAGTESFDVPLDAVVTDEGLYRR